MLETLENYAKDAKLLLSQIALCIRIYNDSTHTINGKLSVAVLVDNICKIYRQTTSPVVFTVPASASAMILLLALYQPLLTC